MTPIVLILILVGGAIAWWVRRGKGGRNASASAGGPDPDLPDVVLGEGRESTPRAAADGLIAVSGLTKRYKGVVAVDDLSFVVRPGRITGFLGPNGAGKTTTLRMILGLAAPNGGTATIGGVGYGELAEPLRRVGGLLEASAAHKDRTGRNHLRILCRSVRIPMQRADEVLELVG
jgi:ABC-type uncharacterized transport system ATPase subunit